MNLKELTRVQQDILCEVVHLPTTYRGGKLKAARKLDALGLIKPEDVQHGNMRYTITAVGKETLFPDDSILIARKGAVR